MELSPKQKEIKKEKEYVAKYYLDEIEDLARALDISVSLVRYRIRQLGLAEKRKTEREKIKAAKEKAFLEDNIATPTRDITAKTGWSATTISNRFKQYGLRGARKKALKGQQRQAVRVKDTLNLLDPRRYDPYELRYVAAYWGLSNRILSEDLQININKISQMRKCIKHNDIKDELEEEFFRDAA